MHPIKPQILKQDERKRVGRGFSPDELKKAGLNLQEARRIEMPIDFRRRTTHDENVEAIKVFAAQEKAKRKRIEKTAVTEKTAKKVKEKPKR